MTTYDKYRFRTPSTGREVIIEADPDLIYLDRDTDERLEVIGKVTPIGSSDSKLPWAIETLRICPCEQQQMIQRDVNDCPYCNSRLSPSS